MISSYMARFKKMLWSAVAVVGLRGRALFASMRVAVNARAVAKRKDPNALPRLGTMITIIGYH